MKLEFLGTRGYIEDRNERHYRHCATMVSYEGRSVMIDCGEDWRGEWQALNPRAVVITHAHPDHAWGLRDGASSPVYATDESWEIMDRYPIDDRRVIEPREPVEIEGTAITFEAFPARHSTRAPAVGYRITAGVVTVFYIPDVVYIEERDEALADAKLYVGDGATLARSMVRKPKDTLIGHTPMRTQLTWCQKEGVSRAIFTHCGSHIVAGDEGEVNDELQQYAQERDVTAEIAYDGMETILR